tara:strand:- start:261 stop:767 length:507 start_codon:yes stop_codon:yes gene_type:complete
MKAEEIDLANRQAVVSYIMKLSRRPPKWVSGNPLNGSTSKAVESADQIDPDASLAEVQEILRVELINCTDFDRARTLKMKVSALKDIMQLEILERTYIHREDLNQHLIKIGNGVKAALDRYDGELPSVMEGMTSPQIKKALRAKKREVLTLLSDGLNEIYEEQEAESY